jgi:NAD(P)-dependent dehydrogenase (short-subunit alcohol dehydrogenase family)
MQTVWLITGASRGFGRAFSEEVVARGGKVIAGLRHFPEKDSFFQRKEVLPVKLDVTNNDQVKNAVEQGIETFGHIDVLVNNAGFGMTGAFEETSDAELRNLFETDYFGVTRMIRAVLPAMRKQGHGIILNISSQGGLMGFVGSSAYCSAKFAVVGLSEVLRMELQPFGIQVSAVCPGSFRTDFRKDQSMQLPSKLLRAYDGTPVREAGKFLKQNQNNQPGDPKKAARFLCDMVDKGSLPSRILIGGKCCKDVKNLLFQQLKEIESYEYDSSKTED